jgi:hypothetical protein
MATGDLTTLEKVRAHIGTDVDARVDATLAALISSSSAWVVSQLGRNILSATYTETRDGDGSRRLLLKNFPVSSVTSLSVDGVTIPARASLSDDGYVLRSDGLDLVGYVFARGVQNVSIVYVAGYSATPADLEQAVNEHVALRYRDRGREGLGSAALAGDSASFVGNGGGTLAYIHSVLDTYRLPGVS